MKSLDKYWYDLNPVSVLLLPVSWLYRFVVYFRKKLYQFDLKKTSVANKPLIVVGNIAVGGSGKTPLLIALCDYLQSNGCKPGVVSRGYGGNLSGIKQVSKTDQASLVGDEPLMIHQRTNVPVVVGSNRVAAVSHLLKHNQCNLVLSDDGLQHYRMGRALEICVVDSKSQHGNGYCLPAGPLREPLSRLDEVDIVVYSGLAAAETNSNEGYSLEFVELRNVVNGKPATVKSLLGKTIHAVSGIGHPERFFQQLRDNGLTIIEHAFPDHHAYQKSDFSSFEKECIVMTEKDAVKCKTLTLEDAWYVIVQAEFNDSLKSTLAKKLLPLLDK